MNKKIRKQDEAVNMKRPEDRYPVFCFKHLLRYSYNECKDPHFFIEFLERLQKLASLGWKEIERASRHGFGTEKIKISQLKPDKLPVIFTDDVNEITVFRATGNNLPFLGQRMNDVFHVVYIETAFGDIYNH